MIKFKPISNRTRRELRDEMREQGLLDIDPQAADFDLIATECRIVRLIQRFVASWDFKSVDTDEPIAVDDEGAYDLMTPAQSTQLMEAFGGVTSGKSAIPPKSGGR